MELRHLRYFVAVAEEMNVHKAAKRLNISQPPLTVTIQQLEQELDLQLFTREGRALKITKAGEHYHHEAIKILDAVKHANEETKNISLGRSGLIRVEFISSAITGILQNIVSKHRASYPDVEIQMEQSVMNRIVDSILRNDCDIGIVRHPMYYPPEIQEHIITKEAWAAAIHKDHPLAKKEKVTAKELEAYPLVFYPRWNGEASYDDVMQFFKDKNVTPNIVQEAPEQMTIAGLVASGIGIGIVPACMGAIKVKNVVHRPIVGTANKTGFAIITRKESDILTNQFLALSRRI